MGKQVRVQVPEEKCDSYGHGHSSGYPHHAKRSASHGSSYQNQHKCHTTYETVYEEKCSTVYDTDYKTEYETTYETACETSYKEECYEYGYDKKCTKVPVEKCHHVPKQIPIQVPREVCESIPKQVPVQVPEKKCDSYGHGHSSGYPHHWVIRANINALHIRQIFTSHVESPNLKHIAVSS